MFHSYYILVKDNKGLAYGYIYYVITRSILELLLLKCAMFLNGHWHAGID